MIKMEKERADKPNAERKEAKKTMPAGTMSTSQEKAESSKVSFYRLIESFAPGKTMRIMRQSHKVSHDALLHEGKNEFERSLILQWRKDGMSDDEIREWLKEI